MLRNVAFLICTCTAISQVLFGFFNFLFLIPLLYFVKAKTILTESCRLFEARQLYPIVDSMFTFTEF